jgi:hypothetical protein
MFSNMRTSTSYPTGDFPRSDDLIAEADVLARWPALLKSRLRFARGRKRFVGEEWPDDGPSR